MTVTASASVRASSVSVTRARSIYEAAASRAAGVGRDSTVQSGAHDPPAVAVAYREPNPTPHPQVSGHDSVDATAVSTIVTGSPSGDLALSQLQALVLSLGQPNPNNFANAAHQEAIQPPADASTTDFYA